MKRNNQHILMLLSTLAFTVPTANADWKVYKHIKINRTPHYFFRMFSEGGYIAYNSHYRNFLLNVDTLEETRLPGNLDPVPSPNNGKIMSIPKAFGVFGGMKFYSTDALLTNSRNYKILRDPNLPGAYQTWGDLGKDQDGTQYFRVVSESVFNKKTGFFVQEYAIREDKSGKMEMDPRWKDERKICEGMKFALPMLSKTGQLMGGSDPDTRYTKIFRLSYSKHSDTPACEVYQDLERPTGKLDFSYDDRFVAFHAESEKDVAPGKREERSINPSVDVTRVTQVRRLPSKRLHLNVFTYDLDRREYDKVTHCEHSNCYYPGYSKNGDLTYLEQVKEDYVDPEFGEKKAGEYYFVFLTQDMGKAVQLPKGSEQHK